jgi:hypothetical protein
MLSVYFDGVPVTQYSPAVFDAFVNQTKVSRSLGYHTLTPSCGCVLSFGVHTFMLKTKTHPWSRHLSPTARTCSHMEAGLHIHLTVEWSNPSLDNTTAFVLRNFSETVKTVAIADGQNVSHAAKYVNYALFGTPLEDIYGGNLERLREIRAAIDSKDVMGLTGGRKF